MLSVTHIMPVLVLLSIVKVGMQQCMIRNQNEMPKFSKVKNRDVRILRMRFCTCRILCRIGHLSRFGVMRIIEENLPNCAKKCTNFADFVNPFTYNS